MHLNESIRTESPLALRLFHLVPIAVGRYNVLIGLWIESYGKRIVEPFSHRGINAGASGSQ
jgi:hypothetical protein